MKIPVNKTIYLVRHCKTSGQEADAPLTQEGFEQAESLGEWLHGLSVERIVSSPYTRAVQSIVPLATRLHLSIETDARLIERVLCAPSIPDWQDKLVASFRDLDQCLPGGESTRAAMARSVAALHDVLSHPATVTVIVTHGNLLTLLLKHFDDMVGYPEWEQLTNPDVYCVQYADDTPHVERLIPKLSSTRVG